MDEPFRPPWHPLEAVPVALAALSATVLVAVPLAATALTGEIANALSVIALEAGLVGFSVAWVAVRYRSGPAALGLRGPSTARELAVGAWFGATLFAVIVFGVAPLVRLLWMQLSGDPPPPIEQPILPSDPSAFEGLLAGFTAIVAAPLGEEVFFRGFLHGSLRARMRFWPAAAISAALFALFHANVVLIVLMIPVGLAIAWLYERRGSLVAPIAAHAMFNVIGYALIVMSRT